MSFIGRPETIEEINRPSLLSPLIFLTVAGVADCSEVIVT